MNESELVQAARELAESDAVEEILRRLEDYYTLAWKNTASEKPDQREQCYRMVMAVIALRDEIRNLAQSEKIKAWNRRNVAADTTMR